MDQDVQIRLQVLSLGRSEIQLAGSSRVPQALVEDVVIVPQGPQEAGDEGTEVEVVGDSDSLGKSKRVNLFFLMMMMTLLRSSV